MDARSANDTKEMRGWQLEEFVFDSGAPGLTGWLNRVRAWWAKVAVGRSIRYVLVQQNRFNEIVSFQLIERDRELVELRHDLAGLTAEVARLGGRQPRGQVSLLRGRA